jgi:hypothetical protein
MKVGPMFFSGSWEPNNPAASIRRKRLTETALRIAITAGCNRSPDSRKLSRSISGRWPVGGERKTSAMITNDNATAAPAPAR